MAETSRSHAGGASGVAPAPPVIGLYEVVLEVTDLAAAERFYHQGIGLPVVERWGEPRPGLWLALGREAFLGSGRRRRAGRASGLPGAGAARTPTSRCACRGGRSRRRMRG